MSAYNKERQKTWYNKNKDKVKIRDKVYYKLNREKILKYAKDYREKNRLKAKEWHKNYYKTNKDNLVSANMKYKYGISLEDFSKMISDQGNKCAICLKEMIGHKNRVVDHDHKNGKVRSLLCGRCNLGLGKFCDNADTLKSAADYVSRWKSTHGGQYEYNEKISSNNN